MTAIGRDRLRRSVFVLDTAVAAVNSRGRAEAWNLGSIAADEPHLAPARSCA